MNQPKQKYYDNSCFDTNIAKKTNKNGNDSDEGEEICNEKKVVLQKFQVSYMLNETHIF